MPLKKGGIGSQQEPLGVVVQFNQTNVTPLHGVLFGLYISFIDYILSSYL